MNGVTASTPGSKWLLSIPAAGRSLSGTVLPLRNSVASAHRALVDLLRDSSPLADHVCGLLSPTVSCCGLPRDKALEAELASAALISLWLTARANLAACPSAEQAIRWFTGEGSSWPGRDALADIDGLLERLAAKLPEGDDLDDLLPYVLEGFQSAELKSVRDRGGAWTAKRRDGVFYTPSDVASHIASTCLAAIDTETGGGLPACLDPACGTGVFLRAALDDLMRRHPEIDPVEGVLRLHGLDVSTVALQSAAFVLTSRCVREGSTSTPVALWERISGQLAAADATTACPPVDEGLIGLLEAPTRLGALFPAAAGGFDVVLGNPPYTRIPADRNLRLRKALFRTAEGQPTLKAFPLFVEMLWRFATPDRFASGMVVPLSIAFSGERQIHVLRRELENSGASVQFEFFDRTPDSLFGDDVKTRNAIVFVMRTQDSAPTMSTTSLYRWNSRSRPRLFSALPSVRLKEVGISRLIPKLGSELELEAYRALETGRPLASLFGDHTVTEPGSSLFYYATAYNWLPVFPIAPALPETIESLSGSLHELACVSTEAAWFSFGVLISDLAYWLWRVQGDGFHLSRAFIAGIRCHPGDLSPSAVAEIRTLAEAAWDRTVQHPTVAVNKGIRTTNFDPREARDLIGTIDKVLAREKQLPLGFPEFLSEHRHNTIIAGRLDAKS